MQNNKDNRMVVLDEASIDVHSIDLDAHGGSSSTLNSNRNPPEVQSQTRGDSKEANDSNTELQDIQRELDALEGAFCNQMLAQRRQDKLKEDPIEELEEVMVSVEEIEGALLKCAGMTRFVIKKNHELLRKH